ncbi:LytR/AlgR family response regulator transcription factor [Niabella beijingensis]|uniref:LytR/AlgR family response regulator transcription factor n=1 Tax=Niabella beijingensis TaxID=2872700 RepID=UPI001CC0A257|nr:LytTR family DNA-binding domain-containing protein [Niabella beijingensis]MBZ4191447.1 LytTR family DNA-binding domain-containing protein [Niabella beijingensis]
MNCLIVDDNKIARTTLKQLAAQVSDLKVVAEASGALEASNILRDKQVDLLLLDIEMEEMTGLELTRHLGENRPVIIFISAKKDYAIEAFELNVADYLTKPVQPARFIQAIDRAREIIASNREQVSVQIDAFLFIRDANVVKRLGFDEILYAEAMGDYVKLHTAKKFYAVHSPLKAVEERLPPQQFIRVHRSYIAAVDKIDSVEQGALIIGGRPVPVADAYRSALNKRLNVL